MVVEELIPEMSEGKHSNMGTVLFAVGFTVMMTLDVAWDSQSRGFCFLQTDEKLKHHRRKML